MYIHTHILIHIYFNQTLQSIHSDTINAIKEIYARVLQIDVKVLGLESDFFELGGSSLDTVALISQMKSHMGIHITQNEFFLHPKVASLAIRASDIKSSSTRAPELVPVPGTSSSEVAKEVWFPASPGQEQMLSCWEMAPVMYNMPTTIKFFDNTAAVDSRKLTEAFLFIVKQQPSLRTIVNIDARTGTVKQRVLPISRASECFELQVFSAMDDIEAKSLIEKESLYQFDLSSPPILRGVLVEVKNTTTSYLLLNQHHVSLCL